VPDIETLVRQLEDLGDEGARDLARSLVRAVLELHGAALSRIVDEVRRTGGADTLKELARDDSVACVLSLHGLYDPAPLSPPPPAADPTLENFVPIERLRGRKVAAAREGESDQCELCSSPLGERHDHLVDPKSRELRCACVACASLFGFRNDGRWKRVRHRADRLEAFHLEDDSWSALGIPIELAFFYRSSRDQRVVAMYPSPAGATESLLSLDAWTRVENDNPVLRDLEEDVEALLVRRGRTGHEHYRVSIDACYALVGRIRKHWRGFGGGADVWGQIGSFFDELRSTASPGGAHG
jgi:hypothetical protein